MPRKTPVRELQADENSQTASPLRRSSRIASPGPKTLIERRNSASGDTPAKIVKAKRLSLSQETTSNGAAEKDEATNVTHSTSGASRRNARVMRSQSKSPPSLSTENEPKTPSSRLRLRKGSISKILEEEEPRPENGGNTPRRSSRKNESSDLKKSEATKPKARRSSATDTESQLDTTEEPAITEIRKKTLRERKRSTDSSNLDAIDEIDDVAEKGNVESSSKSSTRTSVKFKGQTSVNEGKLEPVKEENDSIKERTEVSPAVAVETKDVTQEKVADKEKDRVTKEAEDSTPKEENVKPVASEKSLDEKFESVTSSENVNNERSLKEISEELENILNVQEKNESKVEHNLSKETSDLSEIKEKLMENAEGIKSKHSSPKKNIPPEDKLNTPRKRTPNKEQNRISSPREEHGERENNLSTPGKSSPNKEQPKVATKVCPIVVLHSIEKELSTLDEKTFKKEESKSVSKKSPVVIMRSVESLFCKASKKLDTSNTSDNKDEVTSTSKEDHTSTSKEEHDEEETSSSIDTKNELVVTSKEGLVAKNVQETVIPTEEGNSQKKTNPLKSILTDVLDITEGSDGSFSLNLSIPLNSSQEDISIHNKAIECESGEVENVANTLNISDNSDKENIHKSQTEAEICQTPKKKKVLENVLTNSEANILSKTIESPCENVPVKNIEQNTSDASLKATGKETGCLTNKAPESPCVTGEDTEQNASLKSSGKDSSLTNTISQASESPLLTKDIEQNTSDPCLGITHKECVKNPALDKWADENYCEPMEVEYTVVSVIQEVEDGTESTSPNVEQDHAEKLDAPDVEGVQGPDCSNKSLEIASNINENLSHPRKSSGTLNQNDETVSESLDATDTEGAQDPDGTSKSLATASNINDDVQKDTGTLNQSDEIYVSLQDRHERNSDEISHDNKTDFEEISDAESENTEIPIDKNLMINSPKGILSKDDKTRETNSTASTVKLRSVSPVFSLSEEQYLSDENREADDEDIVNEESTDLNSVVVNKPDRSSKAGADLDNNEKEEQESHGEDSKSNKTSDYNDEHQNKGEADDSVFVNNSVEEHSEREVIKDDVNGKGASESEAENTGNVFIDDMAEEGEEDTPSEGSNDIPVDGESLNSFDTNSFTSESYDQDSFIDDKEEPGLLSGEEHFLEEVKSGNKKKMSDRKKRSRIISVSDTDDEQVETNKKTDDDLENVEDQTTDKTAKDTRSLESARDLMESEIGNTVTLTTYDSDDKTSTDPNLGLTSPSESSVHDLLDKNLTRTNIEDQVVGVKEDIGQSLPTPKPVKDLKTADIICIESDEDIAASKTEAASSTSSATKQKPRRKTSINIQENIKLEDIQDVNLTERICKVVDLFYSNLKQSNDISGNVSLNVSLDYAGDSSADESSSEAQVDLLKNKVEEGTTTEIEDMPPKLLKKCSSSNNVSDEPPSKKKKHTTGSPRELSKSSKRRSKSLKRESLNFEVEPIEDLRVTTESLEAFTSVSAKKKHKKRRSQDTSESHVDSSILKQNKSTLLAVTGEDETENDSQEDSKKSKRIIKLAITEDDLNLDGAETSKIKKKSKNPSGVDGADDSNLDGSVTSKKRKKSKKSSRPHVADPARDMEHVKTDKYELQLQETITYSVQEGPETLVDPTDPVILDDNQTSKAKLKKISKRRSKIGGSKIEQSSNKQEIKDEIFEVALEKPKKKDRSFKTDEGDFSVTFSQTSEKKKKLKNVDVTCGSSKQNEDNEVGRLEKVKKQINLLKTDKQALNPDEEILKKERKSKNVFNVDREAHIKSFETGAEKYVDNQVYKKKKKSRNLPDSNKHDARADDILETGQDQELKFAEELIENKEIPEKTVSLKRKKRRSVSELHVDSSEEVAARKRSKRQFEQDLRPSSNDIIKIFKKTETVSYFPSGMTKQEITNETVTTEEYPKKRKTEKGNKLRKKNFKPVLTLSTKNSDGWDSAPLQNVIIPSSRNKSKTDLLSRAGTSGFKKHKSPDVSEAFQSNDFKNRMLFDPSRVKRMATRTLLKKKEKKL